MLILAFTVFPANNSEQIVFSGTGFGTFDDTPGPIGFWVWCSAEGAGKNKGAYPGDSACQGALYFYALGITKGVASFPTDIPGVTEGPEGIYTMHLHSADGTVNGCALVNASDDPVKGPHNTVTLTCETPSGSGVSTTAVVNVTGP